MHRVAEQFNALITSFPLMRLISLHLPRLFLFNVVGKQRGELRECDRYSPVGW